MDLIIQLAIFAIVVWLVFYILDKLRIPDVPKQIITVVLAIILLLQLLGMVGLNVPHYTYIK